MNLIILHSNNSYSYDILKEVLGYFNEIFSLNNCDSKGEAQNFNTYFSEFKICNKISC